MRRILLGSVVSALMLGSAYAQFSITITVDENGHGTLTNTSGFFSTLTSSQSADPGPGGLASALTYGLLNPPGLVAGDLLLLEPVSGGVISDIIRFNPQQNGGSLVFYSDTTDATEHDLADTGFPTALYTNTMTVIEVGPEGANGFNYTPTAGQPGFVAGAGGPVNYVLQSDVAAPVPEPSTFIQIAGICGILIVGLAKRKLSLLFART